jgi:hypothetical protein
VSTDSETKKPLLIQIDDLVREMTPEEIAAHEANTAGIEPLPSAE